MVLTKPSFSLFPQLWLKRSTLFSLDQSYIFDVTSSANSSHFAVSASNHQIKTYDREKLSILNTLQFHRDNVTEIKYKQENILVSSSKDGSVAVWDLRNNNGPAQVFKASKNEALLSFDFNSDDTALAAGTELDDDAKILFWDVRANNCVTEFFESHNDDITQVRFHPNDPKRLTSGAVDGLICTYDISINEDDALLAVANTGSSVSKIGFFGPSFEYIYCLNHMETFSLWNHEGETLANFGDTRQAVEQQFPMNYAIDCHYDSATQRLYLLGGTIDGDMGIFHVNSDSLQLCDVLSGGHTDIVRSVYWDITSGTMISGGEDAKLCYWDPSGNNAMNSLSAKQSPSVAKVTAGSSRFNPYK
ncbi:WD40 repeat-like protein [Basidiobolus meristosporus CBS 931.73]|uniref:WD40 repeat-like protein n=1 Tax=Basidiobolus meristosporus CBS 931.73 TaxID=1314790 RepID=A0A1Y1YCS3_9FUNG|nr:WD40 repeat-like protein [Basidiobolus meristosporus CBS 931.73]|eukprot:ORX95735.1 WD40 repeat-like protein [Basidiobolus meristosporus CBS 931.73]